MSDATQHTLAVGLLIAGTAVLAVFVASSRLDVGATADATRPDRTAPTLLAEENVPEPSVGPGEPSPTPEAESLSTVLARHDITLVPVDATAAALIGADRALAVARETYLLGTPTVSLARLTVGGYHIGDETTPLAIEDRLVYVVQLTALELYPFGGDASSASIHHELVVFVDASTGEMLLATTAR